MKKNQELELGESLQFFPSFVWLIRDVSLLTVDDGGEKMEPTDYLKKKVSGDFS